MTDHNANEDPHSTHELERGRGGKRHLLDRETAGAKRAGSEKSVPELQLRGWCGKAQTCGAHANDRCYQAHDSAEEEDFRRATGEDRDSDGERHQCEGQGSRNDPR